MPTTIITKYGSGAPTALDVVRGELAVDTENGRLYTETSGGAVIEIGLNPSGNVDVTGTVTADGLTVASASSGVNTTLGSNAVGLDFSVGHTGNGTGTINLYPKSSPSTQSDSLSLQLGGTTFFKIEDGGDISFYEDTGTTPKLFWDASAESLGLGTSIPAAALDISQANARGAYLRSSTTGSRLHFLDSTTASVTTVGIGAEGNDMVLIGGGTELMRLDSSGNVGIGTSSPTQTLTVLAPDNNGIQIESAAGEKGYLFFGDDASNTVGRIGYDHGSDHLDFWTNSTEAMRIDSSGNLLVGKNSSDIDTNGFEAASNGITRITRTSATANTNPALIINRKSSDGPIVDFRKDGTTVGSIGVINSDNLRIGGSVADHAGLQFALHEIVPMEANVDSNGTISLGSANSRFKDLYLSGGVVFPDASSSGTSSSNTLDSYEEGTFSPTLYGASSAGTTTYATVTGNYTKVGNRCTVNFVCNVTATTGTGSLRLGGLPFTSSGENTTAIMINNLNWGGGTYLMAYVGDNNTFARVYYVGDDNTWQQQQITNEAQHFIFTLTYQTA